MHRGRQVFPRCCRRAEHVVVEHLAPGPFLRLGAVAQAQDAVQHDIQGIAHVSRRTQPPVVDHHVERRRRLHVVPPHARIEQSIAGFEVGDQRRGERLANAGKALEVRVAQIDRGDDLPARGRLQRAGVQVVYLLRREQGEAATADGTAGNVVRQVVVRRGNGLGAYPDPGRRRPVAERRMREGQVVALTQSRKMLIHRQGLDISIRVLAARCVGADLRQDFRQDSRRGRAAGRVIETAALLVIREPGLGGGRRHKIADGLAGRIALQQGHGPLRRRQTGAHEFPVRCQAPQYGGPIRREQFVERNALRAYALEDAECLFCRRHGIAPEALVAFQSDKT